MILLKKTLAVICVVLCACADGADEGSMAEEDTLAVEPATPAISLADVAGTWNLAVTNDRGDPPPTVDLVATSDPSGWTLVAPGRDPIPVAVQAAGDSIVTDAGPYSSLIREGVQVSTHVVYRLDGDRLVGQGTARYETADSDSIVNLQVEGTRAP